MSPTPPKRKTVRLSSIATMGQIGKHTSATVGQIEKEIKKVSKKSGKHGSSSTRAEGSADIEPPRLHRHMRLICEVFRINDRTTLALRCFDAATLEDFSLMTDEDFADLILTAARDGAPLPPLQQRKIRVLLNWARRLPIREEGEGSVPADSPRAEGYEVKEGEDDPKYKSSARSRREGGGAVPRDWETRFYNDLPRLREDLRRMGSEGRGRMSNWANEILSFKWLFCNG